jgi:hypothetical protein
MEGIVATGSFAKLLLGFSSGFVRQPSPGTKDAGHVLVADQPGNLSASVGGSATAAGENTIAAGSTSLKISDMKFVSIARGSAEMAAVASSPSGEPAATAAATYAEAPGADFVFITTVRKGSGSDASSYDTSKTKLFAIDLKTWSSPDGAKVINDTIDVPLPQKTYIAPAANFASVDAVAYPPSEGFSATGTLALTSQNQFSHIEGFASAGYL